MQALPWIDVVGVWLGIFLTFAILSYLYKDNPFYKLAEHLFVGVSIGYIIQKQYYDTIKPNLVGRLLDGNLVYLIPAVLVLFMFVKAVSRRFAWLGRYPIALVVALYAGIQINAVAQSDLLEQARASAQSLDAEKVNLNDPEVGWQQLSALPGVSPPVARAIVERRGERPITSLDELETLELTPLQREDLREARGALQGLDAQAAVGGGERFWFGIFSRVLLLLGLAASLVYFYFSVEQRGAVGKVARFGVWVLMVGFGAAFGLTVQGRLSLAIGRAFYVLGETASPAEAAQVQYGLASLVAIGVIVVGLVVWERGWLARRRS